MNTLVQAYNANLATTLENHAPATDKTIIVRPNTAWYNAEVRHLKVIKRRLERKWLKTKSGSDWCKYREQCALLSSAINESKVQFYSQRIIDSEHDMKKLFQTSKCLLGNKTKIVLPDHQSADSLCEDFNNFFLSKVIKIRNTITGNCSIEDMQYVKDTYLQTQSKLSNFEPATEKEVKKIIMNSPSTSCSQDPIPTSLLKEHLDVLLPIITKIVNSSLDKGIFPDCLKHANITPLIKKENLDKNDMKNYRPVSNLSFLSKVIERVVLSRIKTHLNKNGLWEKMQSAYRALNSTETALMRVHNDLLKSVDHKHMAVLVLLDLSAAFDTVDHSILIQRLENRFGFGNKSLEWIRSYLSDRSQSVKIGKQSSTKQHLSFGVPQGSVLGPLLFSLYVAPIGDICNQYNIDKMFYADDTQLYIGFDPKSFIATTTLTPLEQCVAAIKDWMEKNLLKLNDNKTELLLVGSKYQHQNVISSISLNVGDCKINNVDSVRNLGAYFDKYLMMDKFISMKVCSLQMQLRKIQRIRKYLTVSACKTLIQCFFISRLDYASCLLSGLPKYKIAYLQKLQNSAARIIFQKSRFDSAHHLLYDLHWLPVQFRIDFRILVYVFKCLNNAAPEYLSELIIKAEHTRTLRSSSKIKLVQPKDITSYGHRAFSSYAPTIWNIIPTSIQSASSEKLFKKLLKTFFFTKYFKDIC